MTIEKLKKAIEKRIAKSESFAVYVKIFDMYDEEVCLENVAEFHIRANVTSIVVDSDDASDNICLTSLFDAHRAFDALKQALTHYNVYDASSFTTRKISDEDLLDDLTEEELADYETIACTSSPYDNFLSYVF